MWSIAKKYNTTVEELKAANNLSSNLLSIGQILKIPTEKEETTPGPVKECFGEGYVEPKKPLRPQHGARGDHHREHNGGNVERRVFKKKAE